MKIFLAYIFFSLLFVSCKDNYKSEVQNSKINLIDSMSANGTEDQVIANQEIQNFEKNEDCNQILIDFIKSSSLDNPFKENLTAQIEDMNTANTKIMLYDGSNVVGTLLFDAQNFRLSDLTNDFENPDELKFDVKKWNNIVDCYFEKNERYYIEGKNNKNDDDCKTNQIEMGFEKICIIKNSTIKDVYLDLIKNKLVDKSEKLEKSIPQKTEKIKINAEGLISINYIKDNNRVQIEMSFEGGETTILLEQIGNNVKRVITTSAD